jgi:hypothetical protein
MKAMTDCLVLLVAVGLSSVTWATPKAGTCSLRRPVSEPMMSTPRQVQSASPKAGTGRASCAARKTVKIAMAESDDCGCEDAHNQCLDGCGDDSWCQHQCDLDFYRCMSDCNCPRSYETEESHVDDTTYLGDVCGYTFWDPEKNWYGVYDVRIKHERKRVTRECDGSTSEEVLDTWYTTSRCFQRGPWSCDWWPAEDLTPMCHI